MSKRKAEEPMTAARNGRAKRARTVTHEEPAAVAGEKAADSAAMATPKAKRGKKTEGPTNAEPKTPQEDLVVFAFRLKVSERDLIHKAAGAAKASRFVRALSVAAAMGDEKTVSAITRAVKEEVASAS